MTNGNYRRLNRVDPTVAGQELRGLVQTNLIEQQGTSRWTYYTLSTSSELPAPQIPQTEEDRILAFAGEHGSINNEQCRKLLGVDKDRASYLLKKLAAAGTRRAECEHRWSRYLLP
jgi:predicted HTH transcriptional regulator